MRNVASLLEPQMAELSIKPNSPRLRKETTMANSPKDLLALVLCSAAMAGCATTNPVNYQKLTSTSQLAPNPRDKHGHVPLLYSSADNDWHRYDAVIVDPVDIYRGPDQQFEHTSDADKVQVAAYMQQQFTEALKLKFALVEAAGPTTLRVHLTLTGIETNTPVLASLTKIAPISLLFNVVQTARDKQAFFTGSVSYAVEIYDSASNQLLRAYVAKQYPFAENLFASFGTTAASRAGIRTGAKDLAAQLD
jgi:uncharacterized protein DUF3313